LWFLDQSGFCPTLPTGYGWSRLGRRLVVPYEAPQGRRVNVVGALAPYDPTGPRLVYETRRKAEGRYDAAAHLAFVRRLAGEVASPQMRPCVVVLDNYSVHHSQPVTAALPELATACIHFCFLPPCSPDLNPIEPVWRQLKYQDIPERSHPTDTALQHAVEDALAHRAHHLRQSTTNLHHPA
jgi:hypothetical protein